MPRDMFGSVTDPPVHFGAKSKYSVPIAFLVHVAVLLPLIIIPILASDVLPDPPMTIGFVVVPPPPPPPPVIKRIVEEARPRANPAAAPIDVPTEITPEAPFEFEPFEASVPGSGTVDGVVSIDTLAPPPPPPPPAPPPPVRAGAGVRQPTKIRDAAPVYPQLARTAGIQGVVIIEALIDVDGRVQQARVLRSIPLLDQAALEAVQQWQYTPTLLNGQPVPVLMTVTVQFILNR